MKLEKNAGKGNNFLLNLGDGTQKTGFYATRYMKAKDSL